MRDEELRDQLARLTQPVQRLPVPSTSLIRRRVRRRRAWNTLAGVVVLAVAGGAAAAIHSALGTSPAPVGPISPATSSAPVAIPRCAARALSAHWSKGASSGAMGNDVSAIVFRNTGTTTCSVEGWPELAILRPRKLAAVTIHYGTQTNVWVIAPTRVELRPGESAAANVSVGQPVNPTGCAYPTWKVTPPRGQHNAAPRALTPTLSAGAPQVCANTGYVIVSAVYPGSGPVVGSYPSPAPSRLRHVYGTTPPG